MEAYVHDVMEDSMMNWQGSNNPRNIGKMGIFGASTPLMLRFTGYTTRLIELLAHNFHEAFLEKAATKEERDAARGFLGAHLAAALIISGTLGLPGAGWLAGAATRLTALTGDGEGFDVEGHWRAFLGEMFGKTAGSMIEGGAPRALGIDTSELADGQILPFTKLMQDRRKMEDSLPDQAMHILGSPLGIAASFLKGSRELLDGKTFQGIQDMSPRFAKGLEKAFQMTNEGYVDRQGRQQPLTADAKDILMQAVGLTPAKKAEYEEAQESLSGATEERTARAQNIVQNLFHALDKGDREGVQEGLNKAAEFQKDHPSDQMLTNLTQKYMQRKEELATAAATGTPLGANYKDISLHKMLQSGNFAQQ